MKKQRKANLGASGGDFKGRDPYNPAIADQTIDEFTNREKPPANDDAFFNFRSPPNDWVLGVTLFSRAHLFKHAVCLARADEGLKSYIANKARVVELTEDSAVASPIQDAITSWLLGRPTFALARVDRRRGRYQWNAWDKPTQRTLIQLAGECGVSAALLFLIFSIKSMATSRLTSPHTEKLLKRVVAEWDKWLEQEREDFEELLATFTH